MDMWPLSHRMYYRGQIPECWSSQGLRYSLLRAPLPLVAADCHRHCRRWSILFFLITLALRHLSQRDYLFARCRRYRGCICRVVCLHAATASSLFLMASASNDNELHYLNGCENDNESDDMTETTNAKNDDEWRRVVARNVLATFPQNEQSQM